MPMSFPTHDSVVARAKMRQIREPNEGESDSDYREFVAKCVAKVDPVEASEISSGLGWNKQDPGAMLAAFARFNRR